MRGWSPKGREPRPWGQSVLEKQLIQTIGQAVGTLNTFCSWGYEHNNQVAPFFDAKPIKYFITGNGKIPIVGPTKQHKQQRFRSPVEKPRFKIPQ